ncbi:MAG: Shikimate dehydrogenase (NADP(+)) [Anaerolineales bacterium]|nr:Shikimate dehydrogenase (NADP(+)) [Anaerolineales bacterium]WKZ46465.1 MAG: shikimate dehydrogenase [Anaerolineales bacterium]
MNSSFTLPPSSFHLGLLGYPLSHSLSPQLHTAALASCGLDGDYSLFPIHPEDKQALQDLLNRLRKSELHGLNVTIPHKQTVIEFLDDLTPTAQAIGAVNMIYLRENKLIGDNTDAAGFITDLRKFVNTETGKQVNKSALVLGAGGSARAIVYALLNDGWEVTLAARRIKQAQELASRFEGIHSVELNLQTFQHSNFELLINTTPLGMTPNIDQSPLPENLSLPSNAFVYDLVYNPRETKLVRDARAQGLHAATGLGMLIEQAALSFEIWTRCNPSRELMRASIEQSQIFSLQSPIL